MSPIRIWDYLDAADLRLGALFVVLAALALASAPRGRRHVLRLFALYLASLVVHAAAAVVEAVGLPGAAAVCHVLATFVQGIAFISLAGALFFGAVLPALRVRPSKILRDLSISFGSLAYFLYLLSTWRVDVAGIVATSAVITAVIGLSLQDFLTNVMGGLALQLDQSVSVGDWVKFGETSGVVREVSWRQVAVETLNGDTLVIPNTQLMRSPVLLLGRRADGGPIQDRRWIHFHVDNRVAPTAVLTAVANALRREPIPNVSTSPRPDVVLLDFRGSAAEYAARYWLTDFFAPDPTDSAVRTRVWFALKRAGIPLAVPAQSILLTPEDEERERRLRAEESARRLAALECVPIFAPLTPEEKARLADGILFAPYAAGETVVTQGAPARHLYVLAKGSAEVRVSVEGSESRAVATLTAPNVFGEMGLLMGEPRRATVVALEDVECWRVTKEAFQGILTARPSLAEEISHILARREVELAAVREGLTEEAKRARLEATQGSLLSKIRGFFDIG
ncbi:MAG: cyclic nucleotide-binding domain-containing protein [Thermoanaerobaculia bacterium]